MRRLFPLSTRKPRVIFIVGVTLLLAYVFARNLYRLSTSQQSSQPDYTSAKNRAPYPPAALGKNVTWTDYAYVQYVTDPSYLCNSLMIFEALRRHGTRADLLMLYPQEWEVPGGVFEDEADATDDEGKLLARARDRYGARLSPIQVQTYENKNDTTWQDSYTKLLAFKQTQYKRVIALDSDGTLFNNMDELFFLPTTPVAMPRAYWLDRFYLSSLLVVIEPSEDSWERVQNAMEHHEGHDYDMEILNKVFGNSAIVIPPRRYALLTQTFGRQDDEREAYLGSPSEEWNAREVLAESKFVHFSDWPLPKPWFKATEEQVVEQQPPCRTGSEGKPDCTDRDVWLELRGDFSERRLQICGRAYDVPVLRINTRFDGD